MKYKGGKMKYKVYYAIQKISKYIFSFRKFVIEFYFKKYSKRILPEFLYLYLLRNFYIYRHF